MIGYTARRVASLVPVWLGITLIAFALNAITPGDPARIILEQRSAEAPSQAEVEALREELGLTDPLPVRFARYVGHAATGDLGTSYRTGQPVLSELARRFVVTLQVAVPALVLALALSIPLGVAAASRRNTPVDHVSRLGALVGASVPSFWLAYLLILWLSVGLGLLPVAGRGSWRHLMLPSVTLALGAAAGIARLTRASVLEVLSEGYVRTARAMGVPRRVVLFRHALKNALIPVVTLAGLRFGYLLGGAVIVETVFAWPGLGKHVVDAIYDRDYPTVQGFVLFIGTVFVFVNLAVDVLYVRLDPRVRLADRGPGVAA
ncbi:MAG: ABC transporter permease [Actinomycetota bacterium]|nr:ABC transporter permease [Actinomycetota bacterium]